MFCKKCGKEVKEGTAFCGHCGAAAAVLVLVIGLGAALFSGKSGKADSIEGTWKWECSFGGLGALADEFFVEELEEMGIRESDLPNVQGVLEFDKNGKWEFHIDEKEYIKTALEAGEIMLDAMLEEGYINEDEEMSFLEWSGDYEADTKKGEIELTVKRAFGEKDSAEVILEYEIEDKKLSLDIQEDEDGCMGQWESLGIFDQDLTR